MEQKHSVFGRHRGPTSWHNVCSEMVVPREHTQYKWSEAKAEKGFAVQSAPLTCFPLVQHCSQNY